MDARSLWQKTFPLRRALLALFLVWHLFAIVLDNLPWSALVVPFFPLYRPYLGWTGTVQDGWSMYDAVHTWDNHYRILGTLEGGQTIPVEFPGQTRVGRSAGRWRDFVEERDQNFLETLAFDVPEDITQAFGRYLCRRNADLESVEFQRMTHDTPPLDEWKRPDGPKNYETTTMFTTECV